MILVQAKYEAADAGTLSVWAPVFIGLSIICLESTRTMGASHTEVWLAQLVNAVGAHVVFPNIGEINHILRKSGHFAGYGSLGVLFARAWFAILRKSLRAQWMSLRLKAGSLGIGCAFIVACADEYHQSFLPGRGSSFTDVLLDTSGALLLNSLFFSILWTRRQSCIHSRPTLHTVRSLVGSHAATWTQRAKKAAIHHGKLLIRADARAGAEANLAMMHRQA